MWNTPTGRAHFVEITRTQAPGDHVLMHNDDAACGTMLIPHDGAAPRNRPARRLWQKKFSDTVRLVAILSTGDEVVPRATPGQDRYEMSIPHLLCGVMPQRGAPYAWNA
jgi:molybdopterin molybdotransferase